MTGEESALIRRDLDRLTDSVDKLNDTVTEQGKQLAAQAEIMSAIANTQTEMQLTQKALTEAMTKLSSDFAVFRCGCEHKSGIYVQLDKTVNGENGLVSQVKDLNRAKAAVVWATGILGTVCATLLGSFWDKFLELFKR